MSWEILPTEICVYFLKIRNNIRNNASKKIQKIRVMLLGVKHAFQKKGIEGLLYIETFRNGTKKATPSRVRRGAARARAVRGRGLVGGSDRPRPGHRRAHPERAFRQLGATRFRARPAGPPGLDGASRHR